MVGAQQLSLSQGGPGPTEANKAFIRRHLGEQMRRETLDEAVGNFAEDATNHGRRVGREGIRRTFAALFTAFPDMHFTIHEVVAEGDHVVCQVTMEGTHLGDPATPIPVPGGLLRGVAPTGRRVAVPNVHIFRIAGGKIAEHAAVRDDLGMMQQLGLVPTP
ncbi:MAG: ester cyclase [Chloroflexota bacterium]